MAYAKNWMARRRNKHESVYLQANIESAAAGFRQMVEASRVLVDDLTPLRLLDAHPASCVLSELVNRPGTFWDGATGSGMNWRLAVSELEAERRYLRLDGEPLILYSLLSPPSAAGANLLEDLYRMDATMTVALEWRPQRPRLRPAEDPRRAEALFLETLLDERSHAGNRRHGGCNGGLGGGGRIGPPGRRPGGAGNRRRGLWRRVAHDCDPRSARTDRTAGRRHPAYLRLT